MKVLRQEGCIIEDRRAEPSKEKPSLLVEETCRHCDETFIYIIAAKDTSEVSDECIRCKKKKLTLEVHDEKGLLEKHTVWSKDEAGKKLQDVVVGTVAVLRGYPTIRIVKTWTYKEGYWQ